MGPLAPGICHHSRSIFAHRIHCLERPASACRDEFFADVEPDLLGRGRPFLPCACHVRSAQSKVNHWRSE